MENIEIERKFFIKKMPPLKAIDFKKIEQVYLSVKPMERIRKTTISDGTVNFEHTRKIKIDDVKIKRKEINTPLTEAEYQQRKAFGYEGHPIVKTRYLIPLQGGLTAELDIFENALQGLVIVEVEFTSEEQANSFIPPQWFAEECTGLGCCKNSSLVNETFASFIARLERERSSPSKDN